MGAGPTVHIICGFMGAGKTTFAKALETRTGALRITKDEWLIRLIGHDPTVAGFADLNDRLCELSRDLALQLAGRGVDVIVDEGFWAREQRDELRRRIEAAGARAVLHYVEAPVETMRRRVLDRNDALTADTFLISGEMFDAYLPYWQPPGDDEGYLRAGEPERTAPASEPG
ncbi:MAG TPA: ATP-binding protein [Deinococcales bacterium]|nr:ATP-binding protein [Deinococcales bacterium]